MNSQIKNNNNLDQLEQEILKVEYDPDPTVKNIIVDESFGYNSFMDFTEALYASNLGGGAANQSLLGMAADHLHHNMVN